MNSRRYLPSAQFSLIAVSLLLSAGLVFVAESVSNPSKSALTIDTKKSVATPSTTDWEQSLKSVQEESGISLPPAPDQNTVSALLDAAKTGNLTETVSRSLFVNLLNAKAQGLGNDIPTQDKLIQEALSSIKTTPAGGQVKQTDLVVVDSSSQSLHTYGNVVMDILAKDSDQEYAKTMIILDTVASTNDPSEFSKFKAIQNKYKTIAESLADVPVPQTIAPFHLALINNYMKIAATYDGMATLISDPIGGLNAVQQYNLLTQNTFQMFINIAQAFNKNDIIFTKNEPGATWAILLQAQQQTIR